MKNSFENTKPTIDSVTTNSKPVKPTTSSTPLVPNVSSIPSEPTVPSNPSEPTVPSTPAEPTTGASSSKSSSPKPCATGSKPLPKPHSSTKTYKLENSSIRLKAPRKKINIAFIGDSIAHNVNTKLLEEASNSVITRTKAYGSVFDDVSLYPQKNFSDVVPLELNKKYDQTGLDFDVLILQSSSTDITNLDTNHKGMENIETGRWDFFIKHVQCCHERIKEYGCRAGDHFGVDSKV